MQSAVFNAYSLVGNRTIVIDQLVMKLVDEGNEFFVIDWVGFYKFCFSDSCTSPWVDVLSPDGKCDRYALDSPNLMTDYPTLIVLLEQITSEYSK